MREIVGTIKLIPGGGKSGTGAESKTTESHLGIPDLCTTCYRNMLVVSVSTWMYTHKHQEKDACW
eukprot:m.1096686 g.1096686  ORF g.1096686 m.1096686 type:complete len:65 (-) comp24310_c0_seq4:4705-4899(-)